MVEYKWATVSFFVWIGAALALIPEGMCSFSDQGNKLGGSSKNCVHT